MKWDKDLIIYCIYTACTFAIVLTSVWQPFLRDYLSFTIGIWIGSSLLRK